jgi:choline-sulfatase
MIVCDRFTDLAVIMQFFQTLLMLSILLAGSTTSTEPKTSIARSASSSSPNIILITIDTTRADRMGFMGSKLGLTPSLDRLALQSSIFTRAYAQFPLTTPSHASLLTGTYPQFNNVEELGATLRASLPYLPAVFHDHDYQTGAFVGSIVLDAESKQAPGFDRGFDRYDGHFHQRKPGEDRYHSMERRAQEVESRAADWLQHRKQNPFFLWIHFYDPHDPYDPPEPFKSRYASQPYDGEIAYVDWAIGNLLNVLQAQGLYDQAVIAVAADHGEAFGEHGEERHGVFLYDETVHVPLLLKLPARFAGRRGSAARIEQRVGLVDVAPTLLDVAGITAPKEMQGQSLLPLVNEATAHKPAERAVYSESTYPRSFGWSAISSWRAGKYLYIEAPKRELYDQSADPQALQNLATSSIAVADTLRSQLAGFRTKTSTAPAAKTELDPMQAEKLRALGYMVSDSATSGAAKSDEIDPKDKIDVANRFHRSAVDFEEDRYDDGIANLRDLLRVEPDMPGIYLELGRALVHQNRFEEALPIFRAAVQEAPKSGTAHYELGMTLVKTRQWEAALPEAQSAVGDNPNSAQLHFFLGIVELHLKHVPEATRELETSLKIDPDHFAANLKYGEMLFLEGRHDAALPRLRHAVQLDPESAEAHRYLADTYEQLGQPQQAAQEREKAGAAKDQPNE